MTTTKHPQGNAPLTALDALSALEGMVKNIHGQAAIIEGLSDLRYWKMVDEYGRDIATASTLAENHAVNDLCSEAEALNAKLDELLEQVRREVGG